MARRVRHVLALGALALACAIPASAATGEYERKLLDLDQRYAAWSFEQNPTYATDSGIHDDDTRLADFSPASQAAAMARLRAFRNELAALQPPADATAHERVDYLLIRSDIEGDW